MQLLGESQNFSRLVIKKIEEQMQHTTFRNLLSHAASFSGILPSDLSNAGGKK
jgi:hypothetical protein